MSKKIKKKFVPHDIENDYWVKVEEFFKFISNRDDIFYGTNKEVLLK